MSERVAFYLQDTHDLRERLEYVRNAEKRSFEAVCQALARSTVNIEALASLSWPPVSEPTVEQLSAMRDSRAPP